MVEHTFGTDGVYYYCAPNETDGMIGSVMVGQPEAHGPLYAQSLLHHCR